MCLLIAATEFPKEDLLKAAYEANDHGIGLAYQTTKGIKYLKGITFEDLMQFKGLKGKLLIHFRIASVGDKVAELCHPFPITDKVELTLEGKTNAVLAHNGTVRNWKDFMLSAFTPNNPVPPGHFWSDTRGLAFLIYTYGINIMPFVGDGQKIAILSDGTKPEYGPSGIMMYGYWHTYEEGKIWTSQDMKTRTNSNSSNFTVQQSSGASSQNTRNTTSNTMNRNSAGSMWGEFKDGKISYPNNGYSNNPSGTNGGTGGSAGSNAGTATDKSSSKNEQTTGKEKAQQGKERTQETTIKAKTVRIVDTDDWEAQGYMGKFGPRPTSINNGGLVTSHPKSQQESVLFQLNNALQTQIISEVSEQRYVPIHRRSDMDFSEE